MPGPDSTRSAGALPNIYIFTHDSIGVGEDGPTHQPVETGVRLRLNQTSRCHPTGPDPEETAGRICRRLRANRWPDLAGADPAKRAMLKTRSMRIATRRVRRGGYIAKQESAPLDLIILSCGSELQHALAAAKELGAGTRVVSMPCMERFNREAEEYREEVLPKKCRRRVAIEAGVPEIWYHTSGSMEKLSDCTVLV